MEGFTLKNILEKIAGKSVKRIGLLSPRQVIPAMIVTRLEEVVGKELIPVLYEDNYFTLLPGEARDIKATYLGRNLAGENPTVRIDGWNAKQ